MVLLTTIQVTDVHRRVHRLRADDDTPDGMAVERQERRDANVSELIRQALAILLTYDQTSRSQSTSTAPKRVTPGGVDEVTLHGVPQVLNQLREDHVGIESRVADLDSQIRVERREVKEASSKVGKLDRAIKVLTTMQTQDRGAFQEETQDLRKSLRKQGSDLRVTNSLVENVSKRLSTVEAHHTSRLDALDARVKGSTEGGGGAGIIAQVRELFAHHRQEVKNDIAEGIKQMRELHQLHHAAFESLSLMVQTALAAHSQAPQPVAPSNPAPFKIPQSDHSGRRVPAPQPTWTRSLPNDTAHNSNKPPFSHSQSHSGSVPGGRESRSAQLQASTNPLHSAPPAMSMWAQGKTAHAENGNQGGGNHPNNTAPASQAPAGPSLSSTSGYTTQHSGRVSASSIQITGMQDGYQAQLSHPQQQPESRTNNFQVGYPPAHPPLPSEQQLTHESSSTPHPPRYGEPDNAEMFQSYDMPAGGMLALLNDPNVPDPITMASSISQRPMPPPSGDRRALNSQRGASNKQRRSGASKVKPFSTASTASRASNQAVLASAPPNPSGITTFSGMNWSLPPSPMTDIPSSAASSSAGQKYGA